MHLYFYKSYWHKESHNGGGVWPKCNSGGATQEHDYVKAHGGGMQ